jgi:hypothetical protein
MAKKPKGALSRETLRYFIEQGREGGKKSAEVRREKYTPEQRSKIAKKMAEKRWKKERGHKHGHE